MTTTDRVEQLEKRLSQLERFVNPPYLKVSQLPQSYVVAREASGVRVCNLVTNWMNSASWSSKPVPTQYTTLPNYEFLALYFDGSSFSHASWLFANNSPGAVSNWWTSNDRGFRATGEFCSDLYNLIRDSTEFLEVAPASRDNPWTFEFGVLPSLRRRGTSANYHQDLRGDFLALVAFDQNAESSETNIPPHFVTRVCRDKYKQERDSKQASVPSPLDQEECHVANLSTCSLLLLDNRVLYHASPLATADKNPYNLLHVTVFATKLKYGGTVQDREEQGSAVSVDVDSDDEDDPFRSMIFTSSKH